MTVGRLPNIEGGIQPTLFTTKGDILVATGNANPVRQAVGTDGQVLTADSAQADGVTWATPASGGMTLISTTTLSGATTTLSSIPQTYNYLYLTVEGVTGNTANSQIRILPNNVNNLFNYSRVQDATAGKETNEAIGLTATLSTLRTDANNVFTIIIDNYTSAARFKPVQSYGIFVNTSSAPITNALWGAFRSNTAITSLVLDYGGTNTFSGGTVRLYGVK
jgi:hypothetical protein